MSDAWFVVNVGDARWESKGEFGARTRFEAPDSRFENFGVTVQVIAPGQPTAARALSLMVSRSAYVTFVLEEEGAESIERLAASLTRLWVNALGIPLADQRTLQAVRARLRSTSLRAT